MARENYQIPIDSASPDEFFESYEDLFEDDDSSSGPCYLPEKINGTVKTGTLDDDNSEISELTAITVEINGDRNPDGDTLSDGQTEGQSNLNKGKIDEQSAINGEQIEEQSALTTGKSEARKALNGGKIEDQTALYGEPVGTELGKAEIKEDGIDEADNQSGLSVSGYDGGTSNGGSTMSISSLGSVIGDGVVGQLSDGRGSGWFSGKEHKNEVWILIKTIWLYLDLSLNCSQYLKVIVNSAEHKFRDTDNTRRMSFFSSSDILFMY